MLFPRRVAAVIAVAALPPITIACSDDRAAPEASARDDKPLYHPERYRETAPPTFRARFQTSEGAFVVEVHRSWAPRGADRFYNLVRAGFYDDVRFHRVLEDFVVDFGIHGDPWVNAAWRQATLVDDPVTQSNTHGRVTFSKGGRDARTTQIFVNLKDNVALDDDGFAPFGEVVEGMEVLERLHAGYGDGPPRGEGVYQAMAIARGNEYLDEEFPELDRIVRATIEGAQDPPADGGPDREGR